MSYADPSDFDSAKAAEKAGLGLLLMGSAVIASAWGPIALAGVCGVIGCAGLAWWAWRR